MTRPPHAMHAADTTAEIPDISPDSKAEVGALRRALTLLDAVVSAERALTLAEAAELAGLNTSTTHRLLGTLVQTGHLHRDPAKRFMPGPKTINPLGVYHPLMALRRSATQIIRDLRDTTSMTAVLVIILGRDRIVLEMQPGMDPFSLYYPIRLTTPLHASVSGKLLLAHLSPEERLALLGEAPYEAPAPLTITLREDLDAELDRVLADGHATTRDEVFDGMSGVGAPILLGLNRLVGVVVLSGPTTHFTEIKTAEFARMARRAADLLSRASSDMRAAARFLGVGRN